MCKLFILTKTNKIKHLDKATKVIADHLQKSESDGFGYSIQGVKGIFGERTTNDNFDSRIKKTNLCVKLPIVRKTYNSFGEFGAGLGGGVFHGRTSTNNINLINTHPIIKNGWALSHNGVVTNHGESYVKETTNDTEDLVHYLTTKGIQGIEANITGYYAFGALDPEGNLHIVKDNIARLYVAVNKTLDCYIFATTEELITDVAAKLKWTIGPIDAVSNNVYMIFDKAGELIQLDDIHPRGTTRIENSLATKSLGHTINDDYWDDWSTDKETKSEASYYNFLSECDQADASYEFFDYLGKPMTIYEFQQLDDLTKANCIVVRGDGTIVDADDYETKKLYVGMR